MGREIAARRNEGMCLISIKDVSKLPSRSCALDAGINLVFCSERDLDFHLRKGTRLASHPPSRMPDLIESLEFFLLDNVFEIVD